MASVALEFRQLQWSPSPGNFSLGPIDVQAHQGRFIALVGPNGAGKSTLLSLAAGLLRPKHGVVQLFGGSPQDYHPRERGRMMSILTQDPERPFGFTVSRYVAMGRFAHLGAFRRPGLQDQALIEKELNSWGIEALANRPVTNLSGGEFQRVRLARALVQEPQVLALDEPGNHLDLSSRVAILTRLRDEAQKGRCVMAVLHDVNDAMLWADEVWLMGKGLLLEVGHPQDVLNPHHLENLYGVELKSFVDADGRRMLGPSSSSL
ncbi:MAG: ABC transporter ATP-binding protein [Spirochaetales bacterium]|nr:ABC transporter ATP-binding protein [Spirochaetales bacterium]